MNQTPRYNRDDVLDAALVDLGNVAESVLGERSKKGAREWRFDKSPFGVVTMSGTTGRWHNKSTDDRGDVFGLWALGMNTDTRNDFPSVLSSLGNFLGVSPVGGAVDESARIQQRAEVQRRKLERQAKAEKEQAEADALDFENLDLIQAGAMPIKGTPAAVYLRSRALDPEIIPQDFCSYIPAGAVPKHRRGMLASDAAAVAIWARDASGAVVGCQRILIDDQGRKAPAKNQDGGAVSKAVTGRGDGVFIRLPSRDNDALAGALCIGEGPETALAIWQASGAETWCVFGVSGFGRLGEMLPRDRAVILCPDNDAKGSPAEKAFRKACKKLIDLGFNFQIAKTPRGTPVKGDLQDTLEARGPGAVLDVLRDAKNANTPFIEAPAPNSERDTVTGAQGDFIEEWIHKAARGDEDLQNALVRGMQGGGKSTRARQVLGNVSGGIAAMLFPTLEKAGEEYTKYCAEKGPLDVPAMLYRARDAMRDDGGEGPMCERHKEATEMIRNALDPGLLCSDCPFASGCPYRKQSEKLVRGRGTDTPLRIFGAHELAFENSPVNPDFSIIDEAPTRCVEKTTSFGLDDFTTHQVALKENTDRKAIAETLRKVADALPDFSTAAEVLRPIRNDIEAAKKAIIYQPDFKPLPEDTAGSIARKIGELPLDYAKGRKIAGALAAILTDIDAGFKALQSVAVQGKGYVATRIAKPRVSGPILALDGSANPVLTGAWLGGFDDQIYRVERDALVIQVIDKSYATQSLTGKPFKKGSKRIGEAEKLRGEIANLVSNTPRAGLISAQIPEAMFIEALPDTVETAHFNALRGINRLEHCETQFVVGRVQPNAAEISRIAGAYGAKLGQVVTFSDVFKKTPRRLRMRDGSTRRMEVEAHPDPLADIVLRQIRDAEVEQAADRCRPIFNRRTIILMSPVVADFTVDQVVTHAQLMAAGNRLQRAISASRGALRLSSRGLAADAPEVFKTERRSQRYVEKQECKADLASFLSTPLFLRSILLGKGGGLQEMPICEVKLRLKGQCGSETDAVLICPPELIAERAVKAWGELAEGGIKLIAVNGEKVKETSSALQKSEDTATRDPVPVGKSEPEPQGGNLIRPEIEEPEIVPLRPRIVVDNSQVSDTPVRSAVTLGGRVNIEAGEPEAGRWIAIHGPAMIEHGAPPGAVIDAACEQGRCDPAVIRKALKMKSIRKAAQ